MRPLLKIPGGTFLQIQTDIYIIYLAEFFNSKHTSKPGGGGTPHMKGVGMLGGNFELNP